MTWVIVAAILLGLYLLGRKGENKNEPRRGYHGKRPPDQRRR
jgi:hypothetical protein